MKKRRYSSSSIRRVRSAIILCLASDALVTPAAGPYRRVVTVVRSVTATTRRVGSNLPAADFFSSARAFRVASRARGGEGESSLVVGDDACVGPTKAPGSRFATTDGNAARAARAGRTAAGEGRRSAAARRSGVVAFLGGGAAGGAAASCGRARGGRRQGFRR